MGTEDEEKQNNSAIASVVAHCLLDPVFQKKLATRSELVRQKDTGSRIAHADHTSLTEHDRIRLLGGFIASVQHNFLWDVIPASRKLLRSYGMELETFARYRCCFPPLADRRQTREEKIKRFLSFLEERDTLGASRKSAVLRNVLRHEWTIWELINETKAVDPVEPNDNLFDVSRLMYRPRLARMVRLATFCCNAVSVAQKIVAGKTARSRLTKPRHYCYFLDRTTNEITIYQLSKLHYQLLVDTERASTIAELLNTVPKSHFDSSLLFLRKASSDGILRLSSGRTSRI